MTVLDPAEARRLSSSLALLASPIDGEVLAAAGAAKRILEKKGLGFGDLAVRTMLAPPSPRSTPPPPRSYETRALREHQRRAKGFAACGFKWNDWERDFLASIAAWDGSLTGKQRSRLDQLAAKVEAWRSTQECEF